MRVEWALACRYAEVNNNLGTIVGAGIDNIVIPAIPGKAQVLCVVRLAVAPTDANTQADLRGRVLGPDMAPTGDDLTGHVGIGEQVHQNPGWEGHVMVPMMVVFDVVQPGAYTIVIETDGSSHQVPVMINAATN